MHLMPGPLIILDFNIKKKSHDFGLELEQEIKETASQVVRERKQKKIKIQSQDEEEEKESVWCYVLAGHTKRGDKYLVTIHSFETETCTG